MTFDIDSKWLTNAIKGENITKNTGNYTGCSEITQTFYCPIKYSFITNFKNRYEKRSPAERI